MVTNKTVIVGNIINKPMEFVFTSSGQNFYKTYIEIGRYGIEIKDEIPLVIPEKLILKSEKYCENKVKIIGEYRSYNRESPEDGKKHLELYVLVKKINIIDEKSFDENEIYLCGNICKEPFYKKTALGKDLTEIIVAVNDPKTDKASYIPCIAWGKAALYANRFIVGNRIKLQGRIQSRKYMKEGQEKTAYEVSVISLRKIV